MMNALSIYFTRNHSSISVTDEDRSDRKVTAPTMQQVLHQMKPEDLELLVRFSQSVIECAGGNCRKLEEW